MAQHISDEGWRTLLQRGRQAAEHGQKEFMLLRFPSQLCSDSGRAVNVSEPDWPMTLRGKAAEIYLRWKHNLKPSGFHLAARVLDFPGGMPGDIGVFLVWDTDPSGLNAIALFLVAFMLPPRVRVLGPLPAA